jgi:hypothetical protein
VIAEDDKGFQSKWSPSMSVSVAREKSKQIQDIVSFLLEKIQSLELFHLFLNGLLD